MPFNARLARCHAFFVSSAFANNFIEQFVFTGDHAAIIKGGTATTVWWDTNKWDARADTAHNAAASKGKGHHIDIHGSASSLENGTQINRFVIGGDGGSGVGVMHTDFESIVSARLRNPMLISANNPGVVEFRTSNFVTTGHWWEIAIAPTNIVTGAEFTVIPSTGDKFIGNPGSGHRPAEDSINFIIIGENDVPCITGWSQTVGITKSMGGDTTDMTAPGNINVLPEEKDELYAWRLEYYPDKINVLVDLDQDGAKEDFHSFPVNVPWDEVYVYLISIAYQADHHPQDGDCGAFQGQVREFPWKDVKIGPLKYEKTRAYPKENGIHHIPIETGWVGYDTRDTQRFGSPISISNLVGNLPFVGGIISSLPIDITTNLIPQPNLKAYNKHSSMAFCSGDFFGCDPPVSSKTLTFDLPSEDASGISHAQLIYDIKKKGSASLTVNGGNVGDMQKWTTVGYPQSKDVTQWVQRSVEINTSLLKSGTNVITISMSGNVAFDRLQFELGYGGISSPQPSPLPSPSLSPSPSTTPSPTPTPVPTQNPVTTLSPSVVPTPSPSSTETHMRSSTPTSAETTGTYLIPSPYSTPQPSSSQIASPNRTEKSKELSLELILLDEVIVGETYQVKVRLSTEVKRVYTLDVNGKKQVVFISPGEIKERTFNFTAPETSDTFTIVATAYSDGKIVDIDEHTLKVEVKEQKNYLPWIAASVSAASLISLALLYKIKFNNVRKTPEAFPNSDM